MDTLPNEILECILTELHLFQKQECMLVCRRWSDIIRSTNLFSTVDINEKTNSTKLIEILEANPSYRSQIRKLVFRGGRYLNLYKYHLLDYFPKLQSIHIADPEMKLITGLDSTSKLAGLDNWLNQIEVIEQPVSVQILSPGIFFGLKTLILSCRHLQSMDYSVMKYAPNINSLKIIGTTLKLVEFEALQNGLKALQSLTLENIYLRTFEELPDINTENGITALSISFNNTNDDDIVKWLQYINKKYSLLQHFKFIFPWNGRITPGNEENITNNGLVPLLNNLGSRLKHLDISSSDGINTVLRTLDIHNQNIQTLRVNTLFSTARQSFRSLGSASRYIHELTITLNTVFWLKAYYLKNIKTLKKLRIGKLHQGPTRHTKTSLSEILEPCPNSLESLEIYDFHLNRFSKNFKFDSLKNLAIHSNIITQEAYRYISDSLPGVDSLTIDERSATNSGIITFMDKNFSYLEISMKDYEFILVMTLSDGISYYYSLSGYQSSEFNSLKSKHTRPQSSIKRATLEQTKASKKIARFTCNSIKTLVINNKIAF